MRLWYGLQSIRIDKKHEIAVIDFLTNLLEAEIEMIQADIRADYTISAMKRLAAGEQRRSA